MERRWGEEPGVGQREPRHVSDLSTTRQGRQEAAQKLPQHLTEWALSQPLLMDLPMALPPVSHCPAETQGTNTAGLSPECLLPDLPPGQRFQTRDLPPQSNTLAVRRDLDTSRT